MVVKMIFKTSLLIPKHTMFYQAKLNSSSTKSIRNKEKLEVHSSPFNQVIKTWAQKQLLIFKSTVNGSPKLKKVIPSLPLDTQIKTQEKEMPLKNQPATVNKV